MHKIALAMLLLGTLSTAQDAQYQQGVTTRGDAAMGFSHTMTVHHFVLTKQGGLIEAEADQPDDKASRKAIRQHFQHIAKSFAAGDFDLPMFIHDQVPPGVLTMKRLHDQITYQMEPTKEGAIVRIATANPEALEAVHQFLTFQIKDHQTGDSPEVR